MTQEPLRYCNSLPTFCRFRTAQIRNADIVVAAAGKASLIKGQWVRPGAVVVDVAMNAVGKNGEGRKGGCDIH